MPANRMALTRDRMLSRYVTIAAALVSLVVAWLALAPLPASAAASIGLSAGTFKFSTVHGKTLRGELYVSNEGDTPIQVLVYTVDIIPDAKGTAQFVLPKRGTTPLSRSAASWTSINAPESTRIVNNAPYLELAPGKRSHVFFRIDVPDDAPPGDYSEAIFFEMFDLAERPKGTTSRIGGRLGCRVQIRVQGRISENVSVRPFTVGSVVFGSTLPYDFTIHNDGNIDHYFASELQLLDSDEQVKSEVVVGKSDYVYSRSKKVFSGKAPIKDMGIGKYTAELRVSYLKESIGPGGKVAKAKTEVVKQRTFYVVPLTIVIPIGLVLLAVLLFLVTIPARRSRKAARQQPGPGAPGQGPPPAGGWGPTTPAGPQAPVATSVPPQAPPESQPAELREPAVAPPPEERAPEPTVEPAPEPVIEPAVEPTSEAAFEEPAAGPVEELAEEPVLEPAVDQPAEESPVEEPVEEAASGREEPGKEPGPAEESEWKPSWGTAKYYGPPPDEEDK